MDETLPYSIRADWKKALLYILLIEALPLIIVIGAYQLHDSNWWIYLCMLIFISGSWAYWFFTFKLTIYPEGLAYTELFNEIEIPFININSFDFECATLNSRRLKIHRLAIQTSQSDEPYYLNMSMVSTADRMILTNAILNSKPSLKEKIDVLKIQENKIVARPKRKLTWVDILKLIVLFLLFLSIRISYRIYSVLDESVLIPVVIVGLIIGLEFFQPIWCLLAGGMLVHSGKMRKRWENITSILMFCSLIFFVLCQSINAIFDKSNLNCHDEFVVNKDVGGNRSPIYNVYVKSWKPNRTTECVHVPYDIYKSLTPNVSYMRICTKSGALGWEWVCWPQKDGIHNLPKTIPELTQDIARNPNDTIDLFNRGTAYFKEGKRSMAIADFKKVIELDPKFPKAAKNLEFIYNERGVDNSNLGNYSQAISDFNHAIELNPNMGIVYYNRAITYYQLREYDSAWRDVQKAQGLGYVVSSDFINLIKKSSGMDK